MSSDTRNVMHSSGPELGCFQFIFTISGHFAGVLSFKEKQDYFYVRMVIYHWDGIVR